MSTQAPTPKLSGPSMGLCPACGSIQSKEWISGMYGWICGSFSDSHEGRPILFHQSLACASMYWRVRAEKAERERDEARSEIKAVKDILWPNQTGLPNEHRNAAVAVDAIKRLSERQIAAQAAQIAQLREAVALRSIVRMVADYECDRPYKEGEEIVVNPGHEEQVFEWLTEEHNGDCTGAPFTCCRCLAEDWMREAKFYHGEIHKALSSPPPPVVPLEDTRPLVESAKTLKAAKGRHNTGLAYERFLEAVSAFTAKHPLP